MYITTWWVIRVPVILILPAFLYDLEIFFLLFPFILLHSNFGLKTVLNDYLHNKICKTFLIILVRLSVLEFIRYALELLV